MVPQSPSHAGWQRAARRTYLPCLMGVTSGGAREPGHRQPRAGGHPAAQRPRKQCCPEGTQQCRDPPPPTHPHLLEAACVPLGMLLPVPWGPGVTTLSAPSLGKAPDSPDPGGFHLLKIRKKQNSRHHRNVFACNSMKDKWSDTLEGVLGTLESHLRLWLQTPRCFRPCQRCPPQPATHGPPWGTRRSGPT